MQNHRSSSNTFTSGQEISLSGIYRVIHTPHPVRSDVRLLRGRVFPGCPKCLAPVQFGLVSAVNVESAQSRFRLLSRTAINLIRMPQEFVKFTNTK
jgi:hypothetical protein